MPDDELGIARRMFKIDYDPAGPVTLSNQGEDESSAEVPAYRRSLMEMAGLAGEDDEDAASGPRVDSAFPDMLGTKAEDHTPRSAKKSDPAFDESVPSRYQPPPAVETTDDDFFKMIEDETRDK